MHIRKASSSQNLKRWQERSPLENAVWRYYDEIYVYQIIQAALKAKPLPTLKKLYHVLAMARLRCELQKRRESLDEEAMKYLAAREGQYFMFEEGSKCRMGFGSYILMETFQNHLEENDIFNEGCWEETAVRLSAKRLKLDGKQLRGDCGLSKVIYHSGKPGLAHPSGQMLKILERDFQRLLACDDLFDYITISARLLFVLSNYPPLNRGSAAVNGWIIDKILTIKFNIQKRIRPDYFDWFAFYETEEQYIVSYALSCIVGYISTIPSVYRQNSEFYDSLETVLLTNPNSEYIISRREQYWEKLKEHISHALQHAEHVLEPHQIVYLNSLMQAKFIFRRHTPELKKFIDDSWLSNASEKFSTFLQRCTQETRSIISRLLTFNDNINQLFQQYYAAGKEDNNFSQNWADLELLRELGCKYKLLVQPFAKQLPYILSSVTIEHDELRKLIHADELDYLKLSEEVKSTFFKPDYKTPPSANRGFVKAMVSGGIHMQSLVGLNVAQIMPLCNRLAIRIYNDGQFITADNFIAETGARIENNILRWAAIHFCGEKEFKSIIDENIRALLFSYHEVFTDVLVKLSSLVGKSAKETACLILISMLRDYYQLPVVPLSIHLLANETVNANLARLHSLFHENYYLQPVLVAEKREFLRTKHYKADDLLALDAAGLQLFNREFRAYQKSEVKAAPISTLYHPRY